MKKLIFAAAILLAVLSFKQANAQLSISLNLNIDSQPAWGPTGYNHVEYYYFPDINCYYYVPGKQFVYQSGSNWITASSLPAQYRSYDLYSGYKAVVNDPKPYLHNSVYVAKYASYKGRKGQAVIRDSHDAKYTKVSNRPGGNSHPAANVKPGRPNTNQKPENKPAPKDNHSEQKGKPAGRPSDDNKKDKPEHKE